MERLIHHNFLFLDNSYNPQSMCCFKNTLVYNNIIVDSGRTFIKKVLQKILLVV